VRGSLAKKLYRVWKWRVISWGAVFEAGSGYAADCERDEEEELHTRICSIMDSVSTCSRVLALGENGLPWLRRFEGMIRA